MAILPTAHATQRFGSRAIDFYVAPGQVIGSDPRARADERRIQDLDGERHPVRIGQRDFALDAGDYAAVIRLQPGPKRRSRPVAVVNYRTGSWTRTSLENTALLSSAGVSRNFNWLLAVLAMALLALLIVWPQLTTMLALVAPGLAASLPAFDIFAVLAGAQPGLADARLTQSAPGLAETIAALAPGLAGQEGLVIFAAIAGLGALVAFAARSWRFAWMPVFLILLLSAAIAIGGPEEAAVPALLALGGSIALFMLAGLVNRWRDAARLEARIARLADHVLRHPPQEMVTRREMPAAYTEDTTLVSSVEETRETGAPRAAAVVVASETETALAHSDRLDEGNAQEAQGQIITDDGTDADEDIPSLHPAGEEAAAGHDPRLEARSMDIPPPPPMPREALTGGDLPERVNRDAETTEPGTHAEPLLADTETLRRDATADAAGIPQFETAQDVPQDGGEPDADEAFSARDGYVSDDPGTPRAG